MFVQGTPSLLQIFHKFTSLSYGESHLSRPCYTHSFLFGFVLLIFSLCVMAFVGLSHDTSCPSCLRKKNDKIRWTTSVSQFSLFFFKFLFLCVESLIGCATPIFFANSLGRSICPVTCICHFGPRHKLQCLLAVCS